MIEQKSGIKKLAKDVNVKYKLFMQKLEDAYVDSETPA